MVILSIRTLILLLAFVACARAADAQSISGRVVDPQGAAIVNAEVVLTGGALAQPQTTRSLADGSFGFSEVAPGRYTIRVAVAGFVTSSREVTVEPGARAVTVSVSLVVAGVREDVRVTPDVVDQSLTRTNVPLRDQPMNVSTVTGEYLQTWAINDLVEALANVANVHTYQQYGVYEHTVVRGFTDGSQMVDGVRNEGNAVRSQLTNVERVEVLKGPASVLNGNEAIGSTVNIVLKKPSAQPMFDSQFSAGSWGTVRATTGLTGRLGSGSLLYRTDVGYEQANNFRNDPWNRVSVTPSLTWTASPRNRLEIRHSFHRNDVSGDSGIPLVTSPDGPYIPDVPRNTRYNTPQDFALSHDHNFRATYNRTLPGGFGFRNTWSYRAFDDEYWVAETLRVVDETEVTRQFLYFNHRRRPWTNQAELSGAFRLGVRHNVLVGWDHQDFTSRTTRSTPANLLTTRIDLYNPVETHPLHTDFTKTRYDYNSRERNDVYLQNHVDIGSRLKAVVNWRGFHTRTRTHQNPIVDGIESQGNVNFSTSNRSTIRYGLVYQPIDRLDVYGSYASTERPNFNLQPDGSELKSETGVQWEVGHRLRLASNRVFVNTSVFRVARQNVALSRPGGWYDQAGMIRSRGMELEVDGRWLRWFFTAGYGFTDARFLDYVTVNNQGVETDLSGKIRARVPRSSFTYQAGYTLHNGLSLAMSGRYRAAQFLNDANTLSFDGYGLLNVAASFRRGPAVYSFNVSNLTDTHYWASMRGSMQYYPGEPRRFMGSVRLSVPSFR